MKKIILKIFIALGFVMYSSNSFSQVVIKVKPNIPFIKVRSNPPSIHHVWIDGEWIYNHGRYEYVEGYWIESRKGYVYVPGKWKRKRGGYIWVVGYWKRNQ